MRRQLLAILAIAMPLSVAGQVAVAAPDDGQPIPFQKAVARLKEKRHYPTVSTTEPNTLERLGISNPDAEDLRLLGSVRIRENLYISGLKKEMVINWKAALVGCHDLQRLIFEDCEFKNDRIDFVSAYCPKLDTLRLDDCPLDGRALVILKDLPKLRSFLGYCKSVNQFSATIPEDHPTLIQFHLADVPIDPDNFKRLMQFSSVTDIRLFDNGMTDKHLLGITPSPTICTAFVYSQAISNEAGRQFLKEHDDVFFSWGP